LNFFVRQPLRVNVWTSKRSLPDIRPMFLHGSRSQPICIGCRPSASTDDFYLCSLAIDLQDPANLINQAAGSIRARDDVSSDGAVRTRRGLVSMSAAC
jgi:hypothetical protein